MIRRARPSEHVLLSVGALVGLILLWEVLVRLGGISLVVFAPPSLVAAALIALIQGGELPARLMESGQTFLVGFGSAAVFGVVLGLLNGWYSRIYYSFDLILTALYSTPAIVMLPLFIIVLGPGLPSQIMIVFLTGFFPIAFTTSSGIRAVDRQLIRVGRSLGASDLEIFRDVAIPGSVPYILSGLRVGLGRSIVGLLFAEWFGGSRGIGYLVGLYGTTFQTARLLALIVIVIALSLVLVEGMKQIESRYLRRVGAQGNQA